MHGRNVGVVHGGRLSLSASVDVHGGGCATLTSAGLSADTDLSRGSTSLLYSGSLLQCYLVVLHPSTAVPTSF